MGRSVVEYFNAQKLLCNCKFSHYLYLTVVFLAEVVCFTDLSHYSQSLRHLLVGCIGSDPEPFTEHLSLAGLNIVLIIRLNHIQIFAFDLQLQAQLVPFHCLDQD